jgi:hypothetical protein
MNVSMEVNTVAFEAGMQRLREGVRQGFIQPQFGTLPVQARLLAERCQAFTPPRNVGQGKAAVARDITNIFRPLSHTTFQDKGLRRIVRTDDRPAWNKVATNLRGTHNLQGTTAMGFSSDFHKRNRTRRGRGVRAKYGNIGFVTLGPEARQVRKFIGEKKRLVGWARAGWNAGIIGFGGSVKTPWVSKHGIGGGWFQDGTASPDPFVRVGNSTSWAGFRGEGDRILRNAITARARDMQAYFTQTMRVAAAKAQGKAA